MIANRTDNPRTGVTRLQTLSFLVALQFFYAWAWNSSDVLRPAFRATLDLSLAEVGAGYSAQVVGALIGALAVVRFEHVVGRRHTLALVALGTGLSLLSGILVASWAAFLVQRFAVGAFGGAVFPLTIGLIAELFESRVRGRLASLIDGTYFSAVVALGLASGLAGIGGWRWMLLLGGIPPLVFALAAYRSIPDHIADPSPGGAPRPRASVADLFAPQHRARTLALSAMMGANACGHQAFSGWLTTYLYDVARFSGPEIGVIVACQFAGSAAGCIGWGWAIDRYGRRAGAFGLLTAALAVAAFLMTPTSTLALGLAAAVFGLAFAAVVSIGPWLAELYPPSLRTAATSMFQWGRFVSLIVPPLTGALAAHWGLAAAMATAVGALSIAALIWSRLPETLHPGQEPNRAKL
jgi:MFS family permease